MYERSHIVLWVCQWYFSEPIALLSYMSFAPLAPLWVVRKEWAVAFLALHFIQFQQRQHCGFLFFFFHSWIGLWGQDALNGSTIWLYLKAILFHQPAFVFRPYVRPSFSQVRKSESRWWALFFPRSLSLLLLFFLSTPLPLLYSGLNQWYDTGQTKLYNVPQLQHFFHLREGEKPQVPDGPAY